MTAVTANNNDVYQIIRFIQIKKDETEEKKQWMDTKWLKHTKKLFIQTQWDETVWCSWQPASHKWLNS